MISTWNNSTYLTRKYTNVISSDNLLWNTGNNDTQRNRQNALAKTQGKGQLNIDNPKKQTTCIAKTQGKGQLNIDNPKKQATCISENTSQGVYENRQFKETGKNGGHPLCALRVITCFVQDTHHYWYSYIHIVNPVKTFTIYFIDEGQAIYLYLNIRVVL